MLACGFFGLFLFLFAWVKATESEFTLHSLSPMAAGLLHGAMMWGLWASRRSSGGAVPIALQSHRKQTVHQVWVGRGRGAAACLRTLRRLCSRLAPWLAANKPWERELPLKSCNAHLLTATKILGREAVPAVRREKHFSRREGKPNAQGKLET